MTNKNQISLANPFDLVHVFEFKLRLVSAETWQKIQEERMPKKRKEESIADVSVIEESEKESDIEMNQSLPDLSKRRRREGDDVLEDIDNEKKQDKSQPVIKSSTDIANIKLENDDHKNEEGVVLKEPILLKKEEKIVKKGNAEQD